MIDQNVVDEIKQRASTFEVVSDFVKLKKTGVNYTGICPFHDEKSPSFVVNPVKNIYKCFGCGKGGDSISFMIESQKKSFPEAIKYLADKYNIQFKEETLKKEYTKPLPRLEKLEKTTIEYFEKSRHISNNTLLRFKITDSIEWMPKAKAEVLTINFNYYENDQLVNVKYRAKNKDFKLHAGGKLIFYNIDAIKGCEVLVIVEGEIEALTLYECDIHSVVSVPNGAGAGKLNLEYLDNCYDSFLNAKKIILATDGDAAGDGLRNELARRLGYERCYKIKYPDDLVVKDAKTGEMRKCKDANEVLVHLGEDHVKYMIDNATEWPIVGVLNWDDLEDDILRFWEHGFPVGVALGIPGLDDLLLFQDGQFTTITGIPGMGKSEFLDYMLAQAAKRYNIKTAIVSFENQPSSIHATKLMQKLSGKSFAFRNNPYNRMSQDDLKNSLAFSKEHFIFLNIAENDISIDGMLEKLMELVRRKGIKFWVIDPWNYIELNKPPGITDTEHISQCLTKIKRFVGISGTHGFLVAHPTKMKKENGKFEVPNLYSISGSAHFYNKTDNGICVHVDESVFVYVQKVRFDWNGVKGYCEFTFDKETRQYIPVGSNVTPLGFTPIDNSEVPPLDF
jgi:twinkle protein